MRQTFLVKSYSKNKQKTTQKWTFWEFLFFFSRPSPFQFLIKTKLWREYLDQRIKSKEILVLNICEEITIIIDSEVMEFRLLTTKVNTTSACECWWKNSERKNFQGRKTMSLKKPNLLPYCIKNCLLTAHVFTLYLHH